MERYLLSLVQKVSALPILPLKVKVISLQKKNGTNTVISLHTISPSHDKLPLVVFPEYKIKNKYNIVH